MTDNERDIDLLWNKPGQLLVKYQETIKIIVRRYISTGLYRATDFEDVVQVINEELLEKVPVMQAHYNGSSLFRTYFSGIVRNICLRQYKTKRYQVLTVEATENLYVEENSFENKQAIQQELKRLCMILDLYDDQRPKVVLLMKIYLRILITEKDIRLCYPRCRKNDVNLLMQHFGPGCARLRDKEIHGILTSIINKYEKKSNSEDAVRKWIESKVSEIIDVLNGNPPHSSHDKVSLRILFEEMVSPFLFEK